MRNRLKPKRRAMTANVKLTAVDPTRTTTLRRQFKNLMTRGFDELERVACAKPVTNCNPDQLRGADGRCGHGIGLGIPRTEMPQVRGDSLRNFMTWAQANGVIVRTESVRADSLKPTQAEFRQERVDAVKEISQPIVVSSDDRILDGTHAWLSVVQRQQRESVDRAWSVLVVRINLPAVEALDLIRRWPGVEYAENAAQKGQGPAWLKRELARVGASDAAMKEYVAKARAKGAARAFNDVRALEAKRPMSDRVWAGSNVYEGPRTTFLKNLAAKSGADVVKQAKEVRALVNKNLKLTADALPSSPGCPGAKDVVRQAAARMRRVADTEIVRAHAEGQLDALDAMGVQEVNVQAEWMTAGDKRVCRRCSVHAGKTYTIDQARGVIPMHPGCRCAWQPKLAKGGWRLTGNERPTPSSTKKAPVIITDDDGTAIENEDADLEGLKVDLHAVQDATTNADAFRRPENWDKVRMLDGGRELGAGANDWEDSWTWAAVFDHDQDPRKDEPTDWLNIDDGDDQDAVRAEVDGWADELTANADLEGLLPDLEEALNAFCPTGVGGGVNPHCGSGGTPAASAPAGGLLHRIGVGLGLIGGGTTAPATPGPVHAPVPPVSSAPTHVAPSLTSPGPVGGGSPAVHAPVSPPVPAPVQMHPSGLQIGRVITKRHNGNLHVVTVTHHGFQVSTNGAPRGTYTSLSAAAHGIRGPGSSGWAFFGLRNPRPPAAPAHRPVPAPAVPPAPAAVVPPVVAATHPAAPAAHATTPPPIPSPPASPPPAPIPMHSSGLPIGATYSKVHGGGTHVLTVTPGGFQVAHPNGTTATYSSLSAAATAVKGSKSNAGWQFFKIPKPASAMPVTAPTVPTPLPPGATNLHSTIPFAKETSWETGVPQHGVILNGVPFGTAPPKFWEHTADVKIDEPKPLKPIDRVTCMIREPDGRVWIVEPTNHFGNRKNTLPGGGVEHGLSNQQNALKEAFEETGLQVRIVKHLADVEDSNTKRNGRVYLAERIGGAPWDAKLEPGIKNLRTGHQPAAESDHVRLVTPEHAATLLHRTDDLATLATVAPMDAKTKATGEMVKKLVDGLKPAVKAYEDKSKGKTGSSVLHVVQELRGFNEKPTVIDKNDMDALISKGGHIEMLRGLQPHGRVTAKEMTDQFKTGEHFPGFGCFGDGTYADASKTHGSNGNAATSNYGAGGDIIRMALPKTAKIIEQSELEKIIGTKSTSYGSKMGLCPDNFKSSGGHGDARSWAGIHAALAGYDAIHVDGKSSMQGNYGNKSQRADEGFYVILNRSIMTVQKESAKGHVIS